MKLKNSNYNETQKLKWDETQKLIVIKLKNLNCDETQIVMKLNSNCDKTQKLKM